MTYRGPTMSDPVGDQPPTENTARETAATGGRRWDKVISAQLDSRHGPCNMVELMPRLLEQ